MAKKNGLIPLWSDKDVERWFSYYTDRAEEKIFLLLQRAGEEFVKIAREKGKYTDHTGNLRSSIGYAIVGNGKILSENFQLSSGKGTDKITGKQTAKRLTAELIHLYNEGFVLIGVAGMKYAVIVESMENKDVISLAGMETEEYIKKQSRTLFDRLRKKGF